MNWIRICGVHSKEGGAGGLICWHRATPMEAKEALRSGELLVWQNRIGGADIDVYAVSGCVFGLRSRLEAYGKLFFIGVRSTRQRRTGSMHISARR